MTDLKKCPSCGSQRTQESDDDGFRDCLECGLVFKSPLPELPEGYREDDEGDLMCGISQVAFDYGGGLIAVGHYEVAVISKADAQALAIWLQRRLADAE